MGKNSENVESLELLEQRLELKIYSYCFWMRDDHNDFAVYKSLGFFSHTSRFQCEGLHFLTNYNCSWKRVVENRSLFHVLRNVNVWLERNFKIKVDEEELLTQEDLQWMTWHHVLIFSKSYLGVVLDSNLIKSKRRRFRERIKFWSHHGEIQKHHQNWYRKLDPPNCKEDANLSFHT